MSEAVRDEIEVGDIISRIMQEVEDVIGLIHRPCTPMAARVGHPAVDAPPERPTEAEPS